MATNGALDLVYFIGATPKTTDPTSRIKIGYTTDWTKRRREHEKAKHGMGFDIDELCIVRGTRSDERHVQNYFARFALDGEKETFHASEELLSYIRWLRDMHFVYVPNDANCPSPASLELVDNSAWLPDPTRKKDEPRQSLLFQEHGRFCMPERQVTVDDFYTNEKIIEAARRTMGAIDLDPASHAWANSVVKARRFFTIADDGLQQQWRGSVWLNPPFSQWERWVSKILDEWQTGRLTALCVLCATRTLTAQYLAPLHASASALCILRGRIQFWGGRATSSPDDGHAVFYFGPEIEKFAAEFQTIGSIYRKA